MQKFSLISLIFVILTGWHLPTSTPASQTKSTVTSSPYTLDAIVNLLKAKKDIFHIVESPNKKYVAYMHSATSSDTDALTLHLWKVGDSKPQDNGKVEEETVGEVIWSPNSDYILVDVGTYVIRAGDLYSADGLKYITSIGYNMSRYFSPDGKKILFSGSEGKPSAIKDKYVDPSDITNLYIYDIATNHKDRILLGTDSEDYRAIGWLDDQTISYDLNKNSEKNGEFKQDYVKYKYDLKTKKSILDEPQIAKAKNGKTYTVNDIDIYNQKDIFNDIWSPDHRNVVYAKGDINESYGKTFMWRVGEAKPSEIIPDSPDYPVGNYMWSNNSEFLIAGISASAESGGYLVKTNDQKAAYIPFYMQPYFSADSKRLLFSGIEDSTSVYKQNTESGGSHNLSIMDLSTGKIQIVFEATVKIDYFALGWSGENKVVYRKHDYSNNTDEILEYDLRVTFPVAAEISNEKITLGEYSVANESPLNYGVATVTYKGNGLYHFSVDVVRLYSHHTGDMDSDFTVTSGKIHLLGEDMESVSIRFLDNKLIIDYPESIRFGGYNADPKGTYYLKHSSMMDNTFMSLLFNNAKLHKRYRNELTEVYVISDTDNKQLLLLRTMNNLTERKVVSQKVVVYFDQDSKFQYIGDISKSENHNLADKLNSLGYEKEVIDHTLNKNEYDRNIELDMKRFDNGEMN